MGAGTFRIHNFGCRANQADGSAIARDLAAAGWTPAEQAELVILNTCTVTAAADAEARYAIRRIRREQPQARIWVTGCYAQRAPEEVRALGGVERVVGHGEKLGIAAIAGAVAPAAPPGAPLPGRTRPQVKVQDGCGNACSFCVIPSVRGGLRSRPEAEVAAEVAHWAANGAQEVVLTGIHLGQWGRDLPGRPALDDLLRAILAASGIPRLRLSSIEPMNWTGALISLLACEPRIAPHAHVPLQSGSDTVLRRMRRRYRPDHYAQRVMEIRRRLPFAAIGADVMAGFPGETEAEFESSLAFIAGLPLTYLHVFTYSPRPGTEAARRTGEPGWEVVPAAVAARRAGRLRALAETLRARFARGFWGRELDLLTLGETRGGYTRALSANFLDVWLEGMWPPNRRLSARARPGAGLRLEASPDAMTHSVKLMTG